MQPTNFGLKVLEFSSELNGTLVRSLNANIKGASPILVPIGMKVFNAVRLRKRQPNTECEIRKCHPGWFGRQMSSRLGTSNLGCIWMTTF